MIDDDELAINEEEEVLVISLPEIRRERLGPDAAPLIHGRIRLLVDQMERMGVDLGCYLWQMKYYRLYEELGYESFSGYCAGELKWSRGQSYKMIGLAEAFYPGLCSPPDQPPPAVAPNVTQRELAEVGMANALVIAPLVRAHPEEAEEWVARAKTLTNGDLQLAVKEHQDPGFTQVQEATFELARKIISMGYRLKSTSHENPVDIIDEIETVLVEGRRYVRLIMDQTRQENESEDDAVRESPLPS